MTTRRRIAVVVAVVLLLPFLLAGIAILVVQSEWGERWAEKAVASRTHREVQLEKIRLHATWPPTVSFERIRIGNPEWATTRNLVDAEGLAARVMVKPLFSKQIVVPYIEARKAEAGLEQKGDQATWRFGTENKDPSRVTLDAVILNDGHIVYRVDDGTDLDIVAKGSLGESGEIHLAATGKFKGESAKADIRLPGLTANTRDSIRFVGSGTVGGTQASADGTLATDLATYDMKLKVSGKSFKDLHKLTGMVLPDSPPYSLSGRLQHTGHEWTFDPFAGKVGDSDLHGQLTYDKSGKRPLLKANLESKLLDFDDLGPLVGAPPKTGAGETASPEQKAKAAQLTVTTKVLPHDKFSTEKWGAMDADVKLVAARVQRPKQLPVESLSTHLVLRDAVLRLEPLNFGFAGGKIRSTVDVDGRQNPPQGGIKAEIEGLKFAQMFPTLKTMDEALGTMYGRADLKGRGASIAELLGTSNGSAVVAANGGRVSDLLVQLLEIDVAHAAMLLGTRKQQVDLRCAVGQLKVKEGVATPESFVVDTTETNVKIEGKIDLAQERLDLKAKGRGKNPSVFTLKSPVALEGPLKKPSVHPEAGPIVAQAAAGVALAAANPALAIVPFLDAGRAKDADCDKLLAEARHTGANATKTASR